MQSLMMMHVIGDDNDDGDMMYMNVTVTAWVVLSITHSGTRDCVH